MAYIDRKQDLAAKHFDETMKRDITPDRKALILYLWSKGCHPQAIAESVGVHRARVIRCVVEAKGEQ